MRVCLSVSAALPIVMTALVACAGHSGSASSSAVAPAASREGRYTFEELPSGTSRTIEGTMDVLSDSVVVDATPGPCRYDPHSTASGPIVYQCADVRLSFDRRDPVMRATYSFATTESKPSSECTRFTTGPNGSQVCAQTSTQMVDQTVQHTGTLRPRRIGMARY